MAARSVAQIQQGLDADTYDEGYIRFVAVNTRQRVAAGRITKEGGAAYKAITDHQLWEAVRSQSRRGDCSDNALPGTTQAEDRWSRLKTGVLELRERPILPI